MPLIAIPSAHEVPPELRPQPSLLKPKLPVVDMEDVPDPIGWKVVVLPVAIPDQTEGGIALAADTVKNAEITRTIGMVLKIGDLAFSAARGYPPGYSPVKSGDWVNFHSIAGQDTLIRDTSGARVKIKYLNDNDIMGIPPKPEALMGVV